MSANRCQTVEAYRFDPDGGIPNHPDLPMLVYGSVIPEHDANPAEVFERLFQENGWTGIWQSKLFDFHHYHSTAHEVLGVASGSAVLLLGGPHGKRIRVGCGDALLLPAGTGHKQLESSADFLVVGAYPEGQADFDLIKNSDPQHEGAQTNIEATPLPKTDPVFGRDGPVFDFWYAP